MLWWRRARSAREAWRPRFARRRLSCGGRVDAPSLRRWIAGAPPYAASRERQSFRDLGTDGHHGGERVNIHEYQAKEILGRFGIPVAPGDVARTADEAEAIAARYGGAVVVKAQV